MQIRDYLLEVNNVNLFQGALKDIWMQEPKTKSQDDSFLVTSNTSHIEPDLT